VSSPQARSSQAVLSPPSSPPEDNRKASCVPVDVPEGAIRRDRRPTESIPAPVPAELREKRMIPHVLQALVDFGLAVSTSNPQPACSVLPQAP
jgi:hypothetical protein